MKKFFAWMLAGATTVALMVVLKEVFRLWTPSLFPLAALLGLNLPQGMAVNLLWEMLGGAVYAAFFFLAAQRLLPKAGLSSALLYALMLFLVAVLMLPLLKKQELSQAITPALLLRAAGASAFYSVVMVLLGRQLEK